MSDSEVKNFTKAFGTLAQKYPAVITQFKQAITQTKAKLETVSQLNNPILAHYYMGGSIDDVEDIIYRLDENIKRLSTFPTASAEVTVDWRANAKKRFGELK